MRHSQDSQTNTSMHTHTRTSLHTCTAACGTHKRSCLRLTCILEVWLCRLYRYACKVSEFNRMLLHAPCHYVYICVCLYASQHLFYVTVISPALGRGTSMHQHILTHMHLRHSFNLPDATMCNGIFYNRSPYCQSAMRHVLQRICVRVNGRFPLWKRIAAL